MKLSSYCSHEMKMIIFYWGYARLIFTRVMTLDFVSAVSLVSATPLAVFSGIPMTWRGQVYTEFMLDCFLPELWPFVSVRNFINRNSCLRNSIYISQGILTKLSSYCFHYLKMIIYLIAVMLDWFLPEFWSFGNFLTVSIVSATPLAVFSGF